MYKFHSAFSNQSFQNYLNQWFNSELVILSAWGLRVSHDKIENMTTILPFMNKADLPGHLYGAGETIS